jgi:hypothetical protein
MIIPPESLNPGERIQGVQLTGTVDHQVVKVEPRFALLYSRELICGMNTGVDRGATGQMSALAGGSKSAVTRGESFKLDRSLFC